jgi:hypothetical protein
MNFICRQTQGLYPKAHVDVEVSNDDEAEMGPKTDAPTKKASADDEAGDEGVPSAEPHAPNSISSTTAWVPIIVPYAGRRGRKCPNP